MPSVTTLLAACASAVLAGVLLAAPAEAAPDRVVLCSGFSQCADKGLTNAGYAKRYKRSHWAQVKGHNCINYIAYRLTGNSRLTARVPGTGNANTWKAAVQTWTGWGATAVDTSAGDPRPGDIAWWRANSKGAGKHGHLAYVQKVAKSDGKIILRVSEDSVGGTFRWVRLKGTRLPDGYLRFARSTASPTGQITSVTSPGAGRLEIAGHATDPDGYDTGAKIQVRVYTEDGPLDLVTSRSVPFRFRATFRSSALPSGNLVVRTYALNAKGSHGSAHTVIDTRTVAIP